MIETSDIILVTANVGSLFENIYALINEWLNEFFKIIDTNKPLFIALHMQEFGGKNYKTSIGLLDYFFKELLKKTFERNYDRFFASFDTDYTDEKQFTALGNVYFIHANLQNIKLYNFHEKEFTQHLHREVYSGNLNENEYIVKERFEKSAFPNFNWSRKGYLMTKWLINNVALDLVNIHLFHDPSNLTACTRSPSIYSEYRKKALEYTMEKILSENGCFAIFGDFNFRLDTSSLVRKFSHLSNTIEIKDKENSDVSRLIFRDTNENETFTVEQKYFKFHNSQILEQTKQLLAFNRELECINRKLCEYKITFKPSYPFEEEIKEDTYMKSRCPSWCDRILFSEKLKNSIVFDEFKQSHDYNIIGENALMGDHKPIYLILRLKPQQPLNDLSKPLSKTSKTSHKLRLPFGIYRQNYLFINNYLFNLNQSCTNMHNYSKFLNLKCLLVNNLVKSEVNPDLNGFLKIYKENYELRNFFLNKLNGNSIEFKRLINENQVVDDILSDDKRIQCLASFKYRWRRAL